jgi:GT2 family glycosyltransferase
LKVSIIIINYNTFALTCQCIDSIYTFTKGCDFEVILVDNASTECSPQLFKERFPDIRLIANPLNNGFAKGNNLGISHASGDIILLLNSDTYLTEDTISAAAQYLALQPNCGALCCRMVYPDGNVQHAARRFRSIGWELLDLFRFIPMLMPYRKRAQLMLGKYFKNDFNTDCDWVSGAFFMLRKAIIDKMSNQQLDDRFFMYGEDHLWCWQIKQLGYTNHFFSNTSFVHINSGSTSIEKQLALRRVMLRHELVIMQERKGKGLYYYLFAIIYTCKEVSRNVVKWLWMKATGKLIR